ncbi:MAG: oligoendopeptidase F [Spirochaetia bacterium]|jgi:oligoendopeptidase F|nr:oligoendopeptidase F [Spirochaetia bacterium]
MLKKQIPQRNEVKTSDRWNLEKLYKTDEEWKNGLNEFNSLVKEAPSFKGTLSLSPENLEKCLTYLNRLGILEEKIGYYAQLKHSEDGSDSKNQERFSRFMTAAANAQSETSFITPEITSIPDSTMKLFLENEKIKPFSIFLEKLIRFKPHILSDSEEKLLALQTEANQTAKKSFSALTDVDMEFGYVETKEGDKPLSQSTFSTFLIDPDRDVRKKAYEKFYSVYDSHKNTLASLYAGSVHLDVYGSRVRNYKSCRSAALFPDKVPETVYDSLVSSVRENLDKLHNYYTFRKNALKLDKLHLYDVYVPLISEIKVKHTYEEAVEKVIASLAILGEEYTSTLKDGLLNGWVDRYENKGKRSGAFSAGSFKGDPYILMNYKEDVLRDVFTLAHEGGHSMHSWYSARNNPFQHYNYTIFEAEVASTFNEQLLAAYLLRESDNERMKGYLLCKQIDDIIATIFRQTMFAEFEHKTHEMTENGIPLTTDSLRSEYKKLLSAYFGPDMEFEHNSDLEGLRIPHFYRAFYVYKYATGLSAAIALSELVLNGGEKEKADYLSFLKSGGSLYPLESLKLAGVDMESRETVNAALGKFASLLESLKEIKNF